MNLWIAKEGATWFRVSFVEDNRKGGGGVMADTKNQRPGDYGLRVDGVTE
jgi:hypothetical protein